jgi:hypothetical protein
VTNTPPTARLFTLQRDEDVTGVSGTGTVAHGVQWPDGTVAMRWLSNTASTVLWHSIADAIAVHGHDGRTRVVWADQQQSDPAPESAASYRRDLEYMLRTMLASGDADDAITDLTALEAAARREQRDRTLAESAELLFAEVRSHRYCGEKLLAARSTTDPTTTEA